jgi:adenosylhomocysteine nucleosidase
MKIGIITAMPEEFCAVAKSLGTATATRLGSLRAAGFSVNGHEILLVESGMGFDNAARAATALIEGRCPDLLVSAGFCGGITAELLVGDIVVANGILIAGESGLDEVPVRLSGIGRTFVALHAAEAQRTVAGMFVSTAALMSKKNLAVMLAGRHANLAVEMESGAIGIVAAEHNIPLLAIRAVSDAAAEELGFSLDEFCDPEMRRIRPIKVLLTIMRKPGIIPQLVRLARGSRVAAANLTVALARLLPLL